MQIADSFSESEQFTDKRIQRICDLLQTAVELSDYKVRLIEEYFKNNPNARADKEEYLRTHVELIDDIVRADSHYDAKIKAISEEINELKLKKEDILSEIANGEQELNIQKQELEKLGEQAIAQKQKELDELLDSRKQELIKINSEIEKAKKEGSQALSDRDAWKRACESVKDDYKKATNDLNAMIVEWAANNRNTEIIKLLVLHCVNSSEYAPAVYVICKPHETRRSTTTPSFRGIHI